MLTPQTRDRLMDNLGSPSAPLLWFDRLLPAAWWLRAPLSIVKYAVLILWAVGFLWVWFPVFVILFAWDYLTWPSPPSKPPASQ